MSGHGRLRRGVIRQLHDWIGHLSGGAEAERSQEVGRLRAADRPVAGLEPLEPRLLLSATLHDAVEASPELDPIEALAGVEVAHHTTADDDVPVLTGSRPAFEEQQSPQRDDYEPNHRFNQAHDFGTLGYFFDQDLSIHRSGNDDYFRFEPMVDGEARIGIFFTHAAGDLDLHLYDNDQQLIASAQSATDNEVLTAPVSAGEHYYVQVTGVGGATNWYDLLIQVSPAEAPTGELVGIDFGDGPSPNNWTRWPDQGAGLSDLVNEAGVATGYALTIDGALTTTSIDPSTDQIPEHDASLEAIGGNIRSDGPTTFTFDNLDPDAVYELYVFGLDSAAGTQDVTVIDDGGTAGWFRQGHHGGELLVNGERGDSARGLGSYAAIAPPDADGRIVIEVDPAGEWLGLGGLALRGPQVGPPPGAEIHGFKWIDFDGDGVWDENEPPLEDWTIYLDVDGTGQLDPSDPVAVTEPDGSFSFIDLEPGTYTVAEVVPDGWEQTYPDADDGDGAHLVTVELGEVITNVNFGNRLVPEPPTVSVAPHASVVPAGEAIVVDVFAQGEHGVTQVELFWDDGESVQSIAWDGDDGLPVETFEISHAIGAYEMGSEIELWASAVSTAGLESVSDVSSVVVAPDGPVTVSTSADVMDGAYGPGELSLREALWLASLVPEQTQVIEFDDALAGEPIMLDPTLGHLVIDSDVEIVGLGADQLTIDAGDSDHRALLVHAGASATVTGMTITGGTGSDRRGAAVDNAGQLVLDSVALTNLVRGGALYNAGEMSITGATFANNVADFGNRGGAIRNDGQMTVEHTAFVGNWSNLGGAISNSGTLDASYVTVSGNGGPGGATPAQGGGIFNLGQMTLSHATIDNNQALYTGGGITSLGEITLVNVTVSGNEVLVDHSNLVSGGGGLQLDGAAHLTNVTVTDNTLAFEGSAGGIHVLDGGGVTLHNTIVAGNTNDDGPRDVLGAFAGDSAYNLVGVIDGSTGLDGDNAQHGTATDPLDAMLEPLADNGGPTLTHRPAGGSPVIDAGSNALALDHDGEPLLTDQRGLDRYRDGLDDGAVVVDLGAVERQDAAPPPVLEWVFDIGIGTRSSPAIASDGTLYFGAGWNVFAVDPGGALQWQFSTNGEVTAAPTIAPDGTIYVGAGTNDTHFYAINPDGTERWRYNAGAPLPNSSPALAADGTLYFGVNDGTVHAVDADGVGQWQFATGDAVRASPTIGDNGTIYVGSRDGHLYALDPDGSEQWSVDIGLTTASPAIGADGTIYTGGGAQLHAIDPEGNVLWQTGVSGGSSASPAIGSDGAIYATSSVGYLHAFNADGSERWAFQANDMSTGPRGAPAIDTDGTVYFGTSDHSLFAVTADGEQKWRYDADGLMLASPTIAPDGTLYAGSFDGRLYALAGDAPLADSPWPKFQRDLANTGAPPPEPPIEIENPLTGVDFGPESFGSPGNWNAWHGGFTWATLTDLLDERGEAVDYQLDIGADTEIFDVGDAMPPGAQVPDHEQPLDAIVGHIWTDLDATFRWSQLDPDQMYEVYVFGLDDLPLAQSVAITGTGEPISFMQDLTDTTLAVNDEAGDAARAIDSYAMLMRPTLGGEITINVAPTTDIASIGGLAIRASDEPTPGPDVAWAFDTGDNQWLFASPAVADDGTLYIGSMDLADEGGDRLFAINADGSLAWAYDSGEPWISSAAVGEDGVIYAGSGNVLHALNPDGTVRWQYEATGVLDSSPALGADGTVYIGDTDGTLHAVDDAGSERWTYAADGPIVSSPAVGVDGTVYVGSHDGHVHAVSGAGLALWQHEVGRLVRSSPAIGDDGTVYVGTTAGGLVAISADGAEQWHASLPAIDFGSPVVGVDGTVYVGAGNELFALDAGGAVQWQFATEGPVHSTTPVIDADGTIYVNSADGHLYALTAEGVEQWRVDVGTEDFGPPHRSSPTIAPDGTLYVGSSTGTLYAIEGDAPLADSPWPTFRHDLRNTGSIAEPPPVQTAWTFDAGDVWLMASPAIADDGTLYIGSFDLASGVNDRLFAVNPDGSLAWEYDSGEYWISSPTIGDDGVIYAGSGSVLHAVNPDGSPRWQYDADGALDSSAALAPDATLYIGGADGTLYALDADDGSERWTYAADGPIISSPVIGADGTIYAGSHDGHLHAVAADGSPQWQHEIGGLIMSSPAIGDDGTLYVSTTAGALVAVDADGERQWATPLSTMDFGSPVIAGDGTVYVGAGNELFALDADGAVQWQFATDGAVHATTPVIDADGMIYVNAADGYLYALSGDGTEQWRLHVGAADFGPPHRSSPTIAADGTIYVGTSTGTVYALEGEAPLADSPWPKFRHDLRNTGSIAEDLIAAEVVGRHVFYRDAPLFDTHDAAIDSDKQALLPGEQASVEHYTNYSRGLNGLMIDVLDLAEPTLLGLADFTFRVGDDSEIWSWAPLDAPIEIVERGGEGVAGSDRIEVLLPDHVVASQWLEVTMLATQRTGLEADDVFYFGSLPGDALSDGEVTPHDRRIVRQNLDEPDYDPRADLTRSGSVDDADLATVNDHFRDELEMIAPAAPEPMMALSLSSESHDTASHDSAAPTSPARAFASPQPLPAIGERVDALSSAWWRSTTDLGRDRLRSPWDAPASLDAQSSATPIAAHYVGRSPILAGAQQLAILADDADEYGPPYLHVITRAI